MVHSRALDAIEDCARLNPREILTSTADQRRPQTLRAAVRIPGKIVAYSAVPLSLAYGPVLPVPNALAPFYVVAALGLVAILRGAVVPSLVLTAGYVALGWYLVLLAIDLLHGGIFHINPSYQADVLLNGFVLLAFPFFVVGLRELRIDLRMLEWVIMACILAAAVVGLYQLLVVGVDRPTGLNTNPNPYALICLVWSLCLLARGLGQAPVRWSRLALAFVGLVPIVISGSKNGWICATLAYCGLFLAWVWEGRRWIAVAVVTVMVVPLAWILSRTEVVRARVAEMTRELVNFLSHGDTTGGSFGLRLSADIGGLRAFLAEPVFGYGMAVAKLAAAEHRAPATAPFGLLYYVHNEYITYMVAFGIFGLLFILTLLAGFVVAARNATDSGLRRYGLALGGALAVYLMAEDYSYHPQLQGLLFFVLGLVFASPANSAPAARA